MELYLQDGDGGDLGDIGLGPGIIGSVAHSIRSAFGAECSLAVSVRTNGHHSSPHTHDQEQLNYIVEGEMWTFIRDRGYLLRKGDVLRVPRNDVHWSWVKSDAPCVCIEVFSPPMRNGHPLFDPDDRDGVPLRGDPEGDAVELAALGLDQNEIESRPPVNRPG